LGLGLSRLLDRRTYSLPVVAIVAGGEIASSGRAPSSQPHATTLRKTYAPEPAGQLFLTSKTRILK
jgi:hypothetical protein